MRQRYIAWNGPAPTTAAQLAVATGTSIKTLLQIATPSTNQIEVVEWGINFNVAALAVPIQCELFGTTVAATSGTSLTPTKYGDPNAPASACVGGTGATCYSPGTEGTVANARMFDTQFVEPIGGYFKQFPLGERPIVDVSQFLRVRVTAPATASALCWVVWAE